MIASTLWSIPTVDVDAANDATNDAFACFDTFKSPIVVQGKTVVIGDSKKLFKPGTAGSLDGLRHATWSALRASGHSACELRDCLASIAADDIPAIADTPWLATFTDVWNSGVDDRIGAAIDSAWAMATPKIIALRVRIVTPREFNAACAQGLNKADLLSRMTLGLVATLAGVCQSHCQNTTRHIDVFCDRHGGRRFYGGVLQHVFSDSALSIELETANQSTYCLRRDDERLRVRFTVKGDSFVPVALSSMVAKFLRETAMKSFNQYFTELAGDTLQLRPTAGYPLDADRFLADVESIIVREKMDRSTLVRSR